MTKSIEWAFTWLDSARKIAFQREWGRKGTYFSQPVHPFWNWFPSQLMADILAEMIAVLHNQVIRIAVVARRAVLHELPDLARIKAGWANQYWPPKLEAWALSRFDLKNATGRVVMSSKCIFYTMDCTMHSFYSQKTIWITRWITNFLFSDSQLVLELQKIISLWHYLLHQSERYQALPNRHSHS